MLNLRQYNSWEGDTVAYVEVLLRHSTDRNEGKDVLSHSEKGKGKQQSWKQKLYARLLLKIRIKKGKIFALSQPHPYIYVRIHRALRWLLKDS
jgi:hypothetical protein